MKRNKKTCASEVYDKKYYTEFCHTPDEFSKGGVLSSYSFIRDLLAPKKGERILDIGCGRGEIVQDCTRLGAYAVGIDYSQDAVQIAKKNNCRYILRAGATHLPFVNETFDKILLMEVIEHLDDDDIDACLEEMKRVLKNNGYLVVTTPNSWNKTLFFLVKLFNLIGIKIKWMSRDDPYHINLLNPIQLRRLLRKHGFRVTLFPRIKYPINAAKSECIKNRFFFLIKHLRCVAYK